MALTDGDGFTLARIARALAVSRGSLPQARAYAEAQHGAMSLAARVLQRDVLDTGALGDNVDASVASQAFIALAKRSSLIEIINSVSPFARVPFITPFLIENSGALAFWVKEGEAIRTTSAAFGTMRLDALKEATIIVVTNEMLRLTGPAGDAALNRTLQRAANSTEAQAFIDPTNAGKDGESPASITYDVTPVESSGNTPPAIAADVTALIDAFTGDLSAAVWLINPSLAVTFAMLGNAIGAANIGAGQVGYFAGLPAIVHNAVPAGTLVLIDPSSIAMTERIFIVDASTEASIEVTNDDDETTTLRSLWQENLSSLRMREYVNWAATPGAVALITGLYSPVTPPANGKSTGAKA
ncbi:hypothetical protein CBA19CS22_36860 [Caballeronia novacaledonica]|uniref:Uncharacterized protein n=1 Tax=Caballeronia novacaledonica TaxID=1544861 RepID=A0ACB5R4C2_9BURK|nr:hypothetical protein CBA19CS22_36860 [Caballeronia novacaledonica]